MATAPQGAAARPGAATSAKPGSLPTFNAGQVVKQVQQALPQVLGPLLNGSASPWKAPFRPTPIAQAVQRTDQAAVTTAKASTDAKAVLQSPKHMAQLLPVAFSPSAPSLLMATKSLAPVTAARASAKALERAVTQEVGVRVETRQPSRPTETTYMDATRAIHARHVNNRAVREVVNNALTDVAVRRRTNTVYERVNQRSGDLPRLQALDRQVIAKQALVKSASSWEETIEKRVQGRLESDPRTRALAAKVGVNSTADLQAVADKPGQASSSAAQMATRRLEESTRHIQSAQLNAHVVAGAMPALQQGVERFQSTFSPYGDQETRSNRDASLLRGEGMGKLLKTVDRMAESHEGQQLIKHLAQLGIRDAQAERAHIGSGGRVDYSLAVINARKHDMAVQQLHYERAVHGGMEDFRARVGKDIDAARAHGAAQVFVTQNFHPGMTPAQIKKAETAYLQENPGFRHAQQMHDDRIAHYGRLLSAQIAALKDHRFETDSPTQAEHFAAQRNQTLDAASKDPNVLTAALATARPGQPALSDRQYQVFGEFLNDIDRRAFRLGDTARRASGELGAAVIRSKLDGRLGKKVVDGQLVSLNLREPADRTLLGQRLDVLRTVKNHPLIQVSGKQLDLVADSFQDILNNPAQTPRSLKQQMETLERRTRGIEAFDRKTPVGQMLRTLGFGLTAISTTYGIHDLVDADGKSAEKRLAEFAKTGADLGSLGYKGTELYAGLKNLPDEHWLAKLVNPVAFRTLGVIAAVPDALNSHEALTRGDTTAASLHATTAVGGLMATFGVAGSTLPTAAGAALGPLAGPFGLGLMAAGTAGLMHPQQTRPYRMHEPMEDGGMSQRYLMHVGLSESAAHTLVDQSEHGGHSPYGMAAAYAASKGWDLKQAEDQKAFTDWLHRLDEQRQLTHLTSILKRSLDDRRIKGDLQTFNRRRDDDFFYQPLIWNRNGYPIGGNARLEQTPITPSQLSQHLAAVGIEDLPINHQSRIFTRSGTSKFMVPH
ncbi:MAG: hypothetical protein Q4G71_16950 [Pseudomonadota bacterium]|nr:hypothetical protein [Pseudomonadota bacterium]